MALVATSTSNSDQSYLPIEELPWHIQQLVFRHLSAAELCSVRLTSRRLYRRLNEPRYWQTRAVCLRQSRRYPDSFWLLLQRRRIEHLDFGESKESIDWTRIGRHLQLRSLSTWLRYERSRSIPDGLLQQAKTLERLAITSLCANVHTFESLSRFQGLRALSLRCCTMDVSFDRQRALQHLETLQQLEELTLEMRRYVILDQSQFGRLLFRLPALRKLALTHCHFRSTDLSAIFHRNSDEATVDRLRLVELDLSHSMHYPLDVRAMTELDTLERFRLDAHDMDEHIFYQLAEIFKRWPRLQALDLRRADLPAAALQLLERSSSISEMHLSMRGLEWPLQGILEVSAKLSRSLLSLNLYECSSGSNAQQQSLLHYLDDWFPMLQRLKIGGRLARVDRALLFRLAALRSLRLLDVSECVTRPRDVWQILRALMSERVTIVGCGDESVADDDDDVADLVELMEAG